VQDWVAPRSVNEWIASRREGKAPSAKPSGRQGHGYNFTTPLQEHNAIPTPAPPVKQRMGPGVAGFPPRDQDSLSLHMREMAVNAGTPFQMPVASGPVEKEVLRPGRGPTVQAGNTVEVQYVGTLRSSGRVFDRGSDFRFKVGNGEVISGWDSGFVGMREGEKARLVIPPALAYGAAGKSPHVPANATLVFEVTLTRIVQLPNAFNARGVAASKHHAIAPRPNGCPPSHPSAFAPLVPAAAQMRPMQLGAPAPGGNAMGSNAADIYMAKRKQQATPGTFIC